MFTVLVVGDDLTGSNATGALFARRGLRAVTVGDLDSVPRYADSADVLVVNLASRHFIPADARRCVTAAVDAAGPVRLVVKRVDTTLRGNVGAETDAVLDALLRRGVTARALVVPAFPDAGRVTVGGLHLVHGVPLARTAAARDPLTPVTSSRVATVLRQQTTRSIGEIPLDTVEAGVGAVRAALDSPAELVVCDATRNSHLHTIATAAAMSTVDGQCWMSVDSGPFGAAFADALGVAPGGGPASPLLAVVGSITATTRDQILETEQLLDARYVDVSLGSMDPTAIAAEVGELLDGGTRIAGIRVVRPAPESTTDPELAAAVPTVLAEATRLVLDRHRIGGLYATGGDISAAVTAALGADGFLIDAEVLPLAVAGRLAGGRHAGLPFATKGGLIGERDAAVTCLEHLRMVEALRRSRAE